MLPKSLKTEDVFFYLHTLKIKVFSEFIDENNSEKIWKNH